MDTTPVALKGRIIPLAIRRHRRARRISLRLSPARDTIVMTLPVRASVASGMDFLSSKAEWVFSNLEEDQTIHLKDSVTIPVLGQAYIIRHSPGRGISELHENELHIRCAEEFVARRVRDFLKKYMREACLVRAQMMAEHIGKTVREVRVRDTRSRWGSCSASGSLTFHWQLVFAPLGVLDYLIAHEVAHLKEMNHSTRFWQIVEALCPEYKKARKWLKSQGHTLHRYGR
jgi:predicted metal-dependent hydrolase